MNNSDFFRPDPDMAGKRTGRFGRPGWAWLLAVAVASAHADDEAAANVALMELPLEQLVGLQVVSASKFRQNLSEAPSVASVITAEEIRAFGWRTLADALASIRGLYVTSDRSYQYLGARGFLRPGDYNTRFLLLVDGYRVNDGVYDQAPIGTDFIIDMESIERIEYVPGPGSSVYGSNAFFGVINVITRSAKSLAGARGSVEAGSHGQRRAHASYGWESPGTARFLLSATSARSDGPDLYYPEFDAPSSNNGVARGLDHERTRHLLFKAEAADVSLMILHADRDKGIPTASYDQAFNDPRSMTRDTQSAVKLDFRGALGDRTEYAWQLFWGRHDYVGNYVYDLPPTAITHDGDRARWWGGELKIVSRAIERHKLVAGIEAKRDYRRDQYSYQIAPFESYLDDHRQQRRAGVFLQDEITLRDDLLLNAGVRYDSLSGTGSAFSPRLALIYRAAADTTLKLIQGSAYRAPNAYEMYYEVLSEGGQRGNPALRPERIRSSELALEHAFAPDSRATVALFHNHVTDLISQTIDADGLLVFRNIDSVSARGVELAFDRIWSGQTRLRTSYSWQQSEDDRTGQAVVNSPARLAKINLSKQFAGGVHVGVEAQYTASRLTLAGRTASYWVANTTLAFALSRQADLSASVYNLFDRRYADPGSVEHRQDRIAQNGRTMRIRLSYRF